MQINPVVQSMDDYQYRCRVSGTCPPMVFSNAAILNAIPPIIYTSAGDISNSCTGNITIPVAVSNCSNVGAISLALNYDNTKLAYEGYQSPNSELTSGMLIVNATTDQVVLSWASVNPANIGFGTLIEFNFKANAGISTSLAWDTQTPGNCEYSDPNGNIFAMAFASGGITIAANAVVVNAGSDESIAPGGSVQLNGSVTGGTAPYTIQWTPTSWLSNPTILNPIAGPPSTTTYSLTVVDDAGCSGSDNMLVEVTTAGIDLNLKAFLEGPFSGTTMETTLNTNNLLPLNHPYSGLPWYYSGTEYVASIPNTSITDWILVELRETGGGASTATGGTMIAQQTGFILNDGSIVATDGANRMHFDVLITQNLYVVVYHRNHLSIMSSGPLTNVGSTYSWDFTTGSGQAYGTNPQVDLGGLYGMYGGDGDANGTIETADKSSVWGTQAGMNGYHSGDFDMNGQVMNHDKNDVWYLNVNKQTQVPD
ncbi:MAG: cohesin domain-containing protein [Bacteroidales bacterium]